MGLSVGTEGDAGDATYLLSILSQLRPWRHTLLLQSSYVTAAKPGAAFDSFVRIFAPLANSQSYIKECRQARQGDQIEWASGNFRGAGFHQKFDKLLHAHLNHLIKVKGIGHNVSADKKWLWVKPDRRAEGRVIINRTTRYQNPHFPWDKVVEKYKDRILFLGLESEYNLFRGIYGDVEYLKTENFLEAAQLIEASLLFIGNQSCCYAIAEGLKHRTIQETCLHISDCIFKRPNAQYCYDGIVNLPGFDGQPDTTVQKKIVTGMGRISRQKTPPGFWQYPKDPPQKATAMDFDVCVNQMAMLPEHRGIPRPALEEKLIETTKERFPELCFPNGYFNNIHLALTNAGY